MGIAVGVTERIKERAAQAVPALGGIVTPEEAALLLYLFEGYQRDPNASAKGEWVSESMRLSVLALVDQKLIVLVTSEPAPAFCALTEDGVVVCKLLGFAET